MVLALAGDSTITRFFMRNYELCFFILTLTLRLLMSEGVGGDDSSVSEVKVEVKVNV